MVRTSAPLPFADAPSIPTGVRMASKKAPVVPEPHPADHLYDGDETSHVDTVVENPPAEPERPKHSERVTGLAEAYGMTKAEIESYDPDRLQEIVYHIARREARSMLRDTRDDARVNAIERRPEPAPVPEDDFPIEAGVLESKIENFLRELHADRKQFKKRFQETEQREKARDDRTMADAIDAAFDSLPEFADYFGKGGVEELNAAQKAKEVKRRLAVLQVSGIDWTKRPGSRFIAAKIREAATDIAATQSSPQDGGLYGQVIGEQAQRPARRTPPQDQTSGRFVKAPVEDDEDDLDWATPTVRPTHRPIREATPNGEAKAIRNLTSRMKGNPVDTGESGHAARGDFL